MYRVNITGEALTDIWSENNVKNIMVRGIPKGHVLNLNLIDVVFNKENNIVSFLFGDGTDDKIVENIYLEFTSIKPIEPLSDGVMLGGISDEQYFKNKKGE